MRYFKSVFCLCILFFLFPACSSKKGGEVVIKEVETAAVVKGAIENKVLFTGNIEAQDAVDVFPRASGKVSKKLLKEGDPVKRNQTILLVDRDEVGYTFKAMPVVSPIGGLVGTISADVGTNVNPANPVAVVVRTGKMKVKLDIPEHYLGVILPGTEVEMTVDSLGDEKFSGKIMTSSPVINKKTRTARIEIEVPNDGQKLKHGMFAKALLVVEKKENALILSYNSISWEGEKQFVYKVENNKIRRVEVGVGLRNYAHVEVLEGLSEGDRVVVGNLLDLREGEEIKVNAY